MRERRVEEGVGGVLLTTLSEGQVLPCDAPSGAPVIQIPGVWGLEGAAPQETTGTCQALGAVVQAPSHAILTVPFDT